MRKNFRDCSILLEFGVNTRFFNMKRSDDMNVDTVGMRTKWRV